jgi:hypothetical protein
MKLRTSWCAALVACLSLLTFASAQAANGRNSANNRNYQMAGDAAEQANSALVFDDNVEQTQYGSYSSRANGFGVASPLVDRQYRFFGYGEYIYARASFSEALAYIISDPNDPQGGQEIVEYDFDYESSYRFGGGIDFCDCGGALVFNFARYNSSADVDVTDTSAAAGGTIFGPYEIDAPGAGGRLLGNADVDVQSYDIGLTKTFCLGGPCCPCTCCDSCCDPCCGDTGCDDSCCDPCAGSGCCGSGCRPCCPNWELTWGAGARFADVDWGRTTQAFDNAGVAIDREDTRLNFSGAGLRTGLLGRRYIGRNGWFNIFAKGDISLLVGDMDIETITIDDPQGNPVIARSHENHGRRVIPVTEIEAGVAMDLTNNIRLSSGYFIAAWHDLGMRDEYNFSGIPGLQLSHYDDANILGFDGFFARAEIAF